MREAFTSRFIAGQFYVDDTGALYGCIEVKVLQYYYNQIDDGWSENNAYTWLTYDVTITLTVSDDDLSESDKYINSCFLFWQDGNFVQISNVTVTDPAYLFPYAVAPEVTETPALADTNTNRPTGGSAATTGDAAFAVIAAMAATLGCAFIVKKVSVR